MLDHDVSPTESPSPSLESQVSLLDAIREKLLIDSSQLAQDGWHKESGSIVHVSNLIDVLRPSQSVPNTTPIMHHLPAFQHVFNLTPHEVFQWLKHRAYALNQDSPVKSDFGWWMDRDGQIVQNYK